ncbi:unnamed protein product [Pleuronectes platessa]|uniref:Uncharacterized protein n=1 Tax=Pleuronectes platessa TaxID=8262 RepID=A0A9N7U7W2_PLEPL|nr:unnamed protein product [Pleuronectes platessa]
MDERSDGWSHWGEMKWRNGDRGQGKVKRKSIGLGAAETGRKGKGVKEKIRSKNKCKRVEKIKRGTTGRGREGDGRMEGEGTYGTQDVERGKEGGEGSGNLCLKARAV